jgi:hypothetical protein
MHYVAHSEGLRVEDDPRRGAFVVVYSDSAARDGGDNSEEASRARFDSNPGSDARVVVTNFVSDH